MRVWRGWGDKSTAQIAVTHSLGSVCEAGDGGMAQPLTQPVKPSFAPHSISLTNIISYFTLACILGITEQTSYTSQLFGIQAGDVKLSPSSC